MFLATVKMVAVKGSKGSSAPALNVTSPTLKVLSWYMLTTGTRR